MNNKQLLPKECSTLFNEKGRSTVVSVRKAKGRESEGKMGELFNK